MPFGVCLVCIEPPWTYGDFQARLEPSRAALLALLYLSGGSLFARDASTSVHTFNIAIILPWTLLAQHETQRGHHFPQLPESSLTPIYDITRLPPLYVASHECLFRVVHSHTCFVMHEWPKFLHPSANLDIVPLYLLEVLVNIKHGSSSSNISPLTTFPAMMSYSLLFFL